MKKVLLRFAVLFGSICGHAFILRHSNPTSQQQGRRQIGLLSTSLPHTKGCSVVPNRQDEESFTDKLLDRLRRNDESPVVVEGYVTSKRSIGKNLAFLDFQVDHCVNQSIDDETNLCQALLRKDIYSGGFHEGYRRCLLKGSKFRLKGVASPTRIPGNVVLMLHSIKLLALPRQAQHIQIILQHAVDGEIPFDEVMRACSTAQQNAGVDPRLIDIEKRLLCLKRKHTTLNIDGGNDNSMLQMERRKAISKTLKILAKDILRALPNDPQYPVAADQKVLSKEGNFILPPAPKEWQTVPDQLGEEKDECDLTATGQVKQTLGEIMSLANSVDDVQIQKKTARISITGWVQNRRRFDGNVTMIYVVDNLNESFENNDPTKDFLRDSLDRFPCLIHPDVLSGNGRHRSGTYQNLIGSGSKVRVEGEVLFINKENHVNTEKRPKSPLLLWVKNIRLVRSSSRSVNIRHLLDLLYERQIDPTEASEALQISHEDAIQLSCESDATQRQWKANLLAVELQKEASSENNLMRRVDPVLLEVMQKYKYLSKIHPVIATDINEGKSEGESKISNSNEINSSPLPSNIYDSKSPILEMRQRKKVIIGMPGSKWQIKKKPQLEWMGRQIRQVLESHPDFGKRKLTILDIGGGKGALANYLGQNMGRHIKVHVVDISQGAIRNGKKKAKRLDLPVDFQFADASNSNLLDAVDADVVVALHACGHLSDVALNHAVHRQAGFVIVPCCFNSNPHLMIPANDSGRGKNTSLTSVPDWLGLPVGDWSALKLLAEVQDDIPLASEAIGILCAIRAEAAKKKNKVNRSIEIKRFPIQYSTRNTVLVGKCS